MNYILIKHIKCIFENIVFFFNKADRNGTININGILKIFILKLKKGDDEFMDLINKFVFQRKWIRSNFILISIILSSGYDVRVFSISGTCTFKVR